MPRACCLISKQRLTSMKNICRINRIKEEETIDTTSADSDEIDSGVDLYELAWYGYDYCVNSSHATCIRRFCKKCGRPVIICASCNLPCPRHVPTI